MTIIGLGNAGCNIAEMFEDKTGYSVKLIDVDIEGDNCYSIQSQTTPEAYENNAPDMSEFLKDTTEELFFIVNGAGTISGATLSILKTIKDRKINILYIKPDRFLLTEQEKLQERIVYNVLQEYARSGLFKSIFLVDNVEVESILGDVAISTYYQKLNELIFNCIYAVKEFEKQSPVFESYSAPKETSRICTIGLYDFLKDEENILFDLNEIEERFFYFAINENVLKNDGKLFKLIKEKMKQKLLEKNKISYKLFSTKAEQNYCYMIACTRRIQE